MRPSSSAPLCALLLVVLGCGESGDSPARCVFDAATPATDSGSDEPGRDGGDGLDAGTADGGAHDAGLADAGESDGGSLTDAAMPFDASSEVDGSASSEDGGPADAGGDGTPPDASPADAQVSDGGAGSEATWSLVFENETAPKLARLGTELWTASEIPDARTTVLRRIVRGEVVESASLAGSSPFIASSGDSVYLGLVVWQEHELLGHPAGVRDLPTVVVARLLSTTQASWVTSVLQRAVNGDPTGGELFGLVASSQGHVTLGYAYQVFPNLRVTDVASISADTGVLGSHATLPKPLALALRSDGTVLVSGTLASGSSLNGHTASRAETYVAGLIPTNLAIDFAGFVPDTGRMLGTFADDAIVHVTGAASFTFARLSGVTGQPRWTYAYPRTNGITNFVLIRAQGDVARLLGDHATALEFSGSVTLPAAQDFARDPFALDLDAELGPPVRAAHYPSRGTEYVNDALQVPGSRCTVVAGTFDDRLALPGVAVEHELPPVEDGGTSAAPTFAAYLANSCPD